jgi:AcrR family transcriptional regulator
MLSAPSSPPRSSTETKARILLVAQEVFSAKGYAQAGLRDIAAKAGIAPSLVIKYFGTKAKLFEEALAAAIIPIRQFQQDRARLGEAITASILDRDARMFAPAMIALALGDDEARQIAESVVRDEIVAPMAEWLGDEDSGARALNILAMTTGFWIYHRNMGTLLDAEEMERSADLMTQSLQDLAQRD